VRLYSDDTRFWLTEEGKLALLQAELDEVLCSHTWELVRPGVLQCVKCREYHKIARDTSRAAPPKLQWR
jgi:hypothetical protein